MTAPAVTQPLVRRFNPDSGFAAAGYRDVESLHSAAPTLLRRDPVAGGRGN
jgi:hypothetical protein